LITQGRDIPASDHPANLAARLKAELDPHKIFGFSSVAS
jgi:hypothetical protein